MIFLISKVEFRPLCARVSACVASFYDIGRFDGAIPTDVFLPKIKARNV